MAGNRIAGVGFSTWGGAQDLSDLGEILDSLAALDIEYVELSFPSYGILVGGRPIPERVRKLKQACASRPLSYTVHGPISLNFFDLDRLALHKDICRANIDLAAELGSDLLVIHTGIVDLSEGQEVEDYYTRQRGALREMGAYAAQAGVRLAVENVFATKPGLHTADPARLGTELAAIDHDHVVGTLDISHAYIDATWCGYDATEAINEFAPNVGHLHIHDSFGRPDTMETFLKQEALAYGQGDLHLPMGWGSIDWTGLLTDMPVLPDTVFMVELDRDYWDFLPEMVTKARGLASLIDIAHQHQHQPEKATA